MPIELKEYDPGRFFDEMMVRKNRARPVAKELIGLCLLYTSDAADERVRV